MRQLLWRRYLQLFRPGHHVLDIGCGTGTDAVFLARHGVRVTAIDISPTMVAEARSKAAAAGLSDMVRVTVGEIGELSSFPDSAFDGIVSAFAALNTVPSLTQFSVDAARLLAPRGRMIVHLLNRSSLWEWAGLASRGRWTEARGLGRRSERTFVLAGQPVSHYLPRAEQAYMADFSAHFRLCELRGLGIVRPPHPIPHVPDAVLAALGRLDALVGPHRPFLNWGRFVLLDMERAQGSGALRPEVG
jgi:SAM-dependent methyltransferase